RPRGAESDPIRLSHSAARPALDAAGVAETEKCFRRAESAAPPDPGPGEFFESGRRSPRRGNRLEPRVPSLRLSGGGLLGAAPIVSPGALRAAGPRRDGPKAFGPTQHGPQNHARG